MPHSAPSDQGVTTPPPRHLRGDLMSLAIYPEVRVAGRVQTGYRLDCSRSGLAMFLTGAELLDIAAIVAELDSLEVVS